MPVLKSFSGSSLPPWLIVTLEQRRQENRAYGDALSPSLVFTAGILSARELVLVHCGLL